MSDLKELSIFDKGLTKSDILIMAINALENIRENGNPLQAAEALVSMEAFTKELKSNDDFKAYVREEISKHKGGYISKSGAKIELAETGVDYDFSKCNDNILIDFEEKLLYAKDRVDNRKRFLKTIPLSGLEVVDKDGGEVMTIYPPTKISTSSFKITLAK